MEIKEIEEYIKELVRRRKEAIVAFTDKKIEALENLNKPDIVLDGSGRKNTDDAVEQGVVKESDFLIKVAESHINLLEEILEWMLSS